LVLPLIHLSEEQLDQIYFTCDNQEEFDERFGQDPARRPRPDVNEFENQIKQHMPDEEPLPYTISSFQEE
jgi:hypothetical protein